MIRAALPIAVAILLSGCAARAGETPSTPVPPPPAGGEKQAKPAENPGPPDRPKPPGELVPPQETDPKPDASEEEKARAARLAAQVAKLIKDLGSEDWGTRENAQAELVKIGEPAEKALEAAAGSQDAEVAQRARAALLSIRGAGYLGIYIAEGPEPPDEKSPRGCLITGFVELEGREPGDLKEEDIILSVNGGRVDTVTDLQRLVVKCRPGSRAKLEVRREGEVKTIDVKVYQWPEGIPRPELPD